jgi:hypothetical protein
MNYDTCICTDWERAGKCVGFCWGSQKEIDHLENKDADGRIRSEFVLERLAVRMQSGSNWFMIGAGGGLL